MRGTHADPIFFAVSFICAGVYHRAEPLGQSPFSWNLRPCGDALRASATNLKEGIVSKLAACLRSSNSAERDPAPRFIYSLFGEEWSIIVLLRERSPFPLSSFVSTPVKHLDLGAGNPSSTMLLLQITWQKLRWSLISIRQVWRKRWVAPGPCQADRCHDHKAWGVRNDKTPSGRAAVVGGRAESQVLNLVVIPEPRFDLPSLGLTVTLRDGHLIALDAFNAVLNTRIRPIAAVGQDWAGV